jgi:low temperature requirement protein LtrA
MIDIDIILILAVWFLWLFAGIVAKYGGKNERAF